MIAKEKTRTVQSQGIQHSVSFGIKASGIAHIFNVLRNQLYTDKVTAVVREYSTNACDAHVEAGVKERPIEVTLPSRFNLEFKVRDFGPALSDKDIQDIYAFYGESTKRNTNEQTGMLGIGSKSAFAYGDNFVINSFIGGEKNTYNAFIDDTQVGQISKLSTVSTDEENGIEIVVPVRSEDVDEFKSKGESVFTYFKTKPIVNGNQLPEEQHDVLYSGGDWKYISRDDNSYHRSGDAVVIMGNIGYPIDTDLLKLKDEDSELANLACANLLLEIPLGDVEISASREGLQYTDYTIKNLTKKLKEVSKEIAKEVEKSFVECETLWQAKILASELFSYHGKLHAIQHFVKKNIAWQGTPVGDYDAAIVVPSDGKYDEFVEVHKYDKSYRANSKVTASASTRIACDGKTKIILNDNCHRRGAISKMVYQVETEDRSPYIITFKKKTYTKQKEAILKDAGLSYKDIVMLSTLQDAKLDGRYSRASGGGSNGKGSSKVFTHNGSNSGGYRSDPQSSYWDAATVDLKKEKVLYVKLDRFQYINAKEYPINARGFTDHVLDKAKDLIPSTHKVVGVKLSDVGRFEKSANATELWPFLKEQLAKAIEDANISTEAATIKEYEAAERIWTRMANNRDLLNGQTLLTGYLESLASAAKVRLRLKGDDASSKEAKQYKNLTELASELQVEIAKGTPNFSNSVVDTITTQYPMVTLAGEQIAGSYWRDDDEGDLEKHKLFADYVNMIESSSRDE
jgi:hypothetical protein